MAEKNTTAFDEGCLICGDELIYSNKLEEKNCYFCQKYFTSDVSCPDDHYVCDRCHSSSANQAILDFCIKTELQDPIEIANVLMNNQKIKMHGPEHHFLVPAALVAAYYNIQNKPLVKKKKLYVAMKRSESVPGGYCGTHGSCGAGIGTGIFISIITQATPLSGKEWQQSNLMTSTCLYKIALSGGPRCCKRDTFISLKEASKFATEKLGFSFPEHKSIICSYSSRNKQCLEKSCQFYAPN